MRRDGWTAVDLLFVIVLGLLTLSLALPMLSAARWRSQRLVSESQLERVGQAIETYRSDHEAYPGYFPRSHWKSALFRYRFNDSENLVLSLVGGVVDRVQAKEPYQPHPSMKDRAIDLSHFGSAESRRAYGAYFEPRTGELGVMRNTYPGPDNAMPELIDRTTNWPVLYFSPQPTGTKPAGQAATNATVFSTASHSNILLAMNLMNPNGARITQAYSLLSFRPMASATKADASANLAMLVIDPAASDLGSGGSPNQANDEDDAVRDAGCLLLAPGWDGQYLSRLQHRSERRVIERPEDLEQFDDVWHWTARR